VRLLLSALSAKYFAEAIGGVCRCLFAKCEEMFGIMKSRTLADVAIADVRHHIVA
jgi:hypothetical protein